MSLGEGHFCAVVQPLPNEQVLWEGGPDPRATAIRLVHFGVLLAIPVVFLVWFFSMLALLPTPSGTRRARQSVDQQAVHEARATEGEPRRSWMPVMGLLAGGVFVLAAGVVLEARLWHRNAWYVITTERVCVQSGALARSLTLLDLDKLLLVQVTDSWLERRLGLQSIEFLHAAVRASANGRGLSRERVAIECVSSAGEVVSNLVNSWLPRDNAHRWSGGRGGRTTG